MPAMIRLKKAIKGSNRLYKTPIGHMKLKYAK